MNARRYGRVLGRILLVTVVLAVAGLAWWLQPQPLLPEANDALAATPEVSARPASDGLEWAPTASDPLVGLIVYPGGKVPPAAYAPLAREIAAAGYLVVICPMPLNLAVLGIGCADLPISQHPEIAVWAIAGHSLGGSMAAQYAADHPDEVGALALWASYSATDLSDSGLYALSIWGALDAGAGRMGGPEARGVLPPDATFIELPGANHEQMGWYTGQPNDPAATISRAEQQHAVAAATIELLARLAE